MTDTALCNAIHNIIDSGDRYFLVSDTAPRECCVFAPFNWGFFGDIADGIGA